VDFECVVLVGEECCCCGGEMFFVGVGDFGDFVVLDFGFFGCVGECFGDGVGGYELCLYFGYVGDVILDCLFD